MKMRNVDLLLWQKLRKFYNVIKSKLRKVEIKLIE